MAKSGDPRVLALLNLVLSAVYGTGIVWGLSFIGVTEFTLPNVAIAVAVIALVTYVAVLRD